MKKYASTIYLCLIFGILYIPIVTVILFSLNAPASTAEVSGFSFRWYRELFRSEEAWIALRNTLILAVSSALIATVIGTAAAEGIYKMRSKLYKTAVTSVTNIPMMNPDIVTGMSMMLFFAAVMSVFKIANYNSIGFFAMLIAHTTFCLPYVILSVLPRINELGNSLSEAALDLGCTPIQAFFKVKLPNIMPGVISGMVMAFTMSLDDFAVTFFTRGTIGLDTLSTYIYTDARKGGLTPELRPMITIMFLGILTLLIVINLRKARAANNAAK